MNAIRTLWHKNRMLVLAFVLMAAITLFFAVRFVLFALYWNDPAHWNQPLEGWMTMGYVAHSYHVDPRDIDAGLDLAKPHERQTLEQIARDNGMTLEELKAKVEATLTKLKAERPAE
ncbi:hypothetical protein [Rhizobium sp. PAMB 3182]